MSRIGPGHDPSSDDRADDAPNGDAEGPPIRNIELEFLRAGPAHNQLLSPLVPYLALCGAGGPVSVHLPFEHAQLLTRLNRLRYVTDGLPVAAAQRDAELRDLGEAVGRLLATIPALVAELHAARADAGRFTHIRLRISAFELALVPFEATLSPVDPTGSAGPLLLGTSTGMTREIRRGEPLALHWNREPKILFAFASPTDLPEVPAQQHVDALRRAIDPWVGIKDSAAERLVDVRRLLTVLKNANIAKISAACRADDYTHVHILAHGAPLPDAENRRFGLCLARDDGGDGHVVVDGQTLAIALTRTVGGDGRTQRAPSVVTLATCDSGNVGSVMTPGGSIAHELHAGDIPWVIASQFPLGMAASSIAAEALYGGLLAGIDPRRVLHDVRQRLRIELPAMHDWASLVAYAAIAPDLDAQVDAFHSRQTKARLDLKFERMDALVGGSGGGPPGAAPGLAGRKAATVGIELERLCATVRAELAAWCDEPITRRDPRQRAGRLAMRAASEKRIAIVYGLWAALGDGNSGGSGSGDNSGGSGGGSGASGGSGGSDGGSTSSSTTTSSSSSSSSSSSGSGSGSGSSGSGSGSGSGSVGSGSIGRIGSGSVGSGSGSGSSVGSGSGSNGNSDSSGARSAAAASGPTVSNPRADGNGAQARSDAAYRLARGHYRGALKAQPASHWAITQYLAIIATPALAPTDAALTALAASHGRWWQTALQLAEWDAAASSGRARAWAHGTLAELELLGAVYCVGERSAEARRQAVGAECRRLCDACDDDDRFPVASTRRQFQRYLDHWPRAEWHDLAQAAIASLEGPGCDG